MQRSCTSTTSALICCWEGCPNRYFQNWGGRETWQHRILQVFWNNWMGCSVPRWVSGEMPSLEKKAPARAGGRVCSLGVALLSNASLGVFDKLTLCTLSVGLSLSNTRSATLQLLGSRWPRRMPAWAHRGKRSTAAVVNFTGFFQLAKSIIYPSIFPPPAFFFG